MSFLCMGVWFPCYILFNVTWKIIGWFKDLLRSSSAFICTKKSRNFLWKEKGIQISSVTSRPMIKKKALMVFQLRLRKWKSTFGRSSRVCALIVNIRCSCACMLVLVFWSHLNGEYALTCDFHFMLFWILFYYLFL